MPPDCDNGRVGTPNEDWLDRLLVAIAKRSSGRVIFLLAVASYAGIGLALPLALGWSVPWLVSANLLGASLAFLLAIVWFAVRVEEANRRHLVEWTTDLRLLDAAEFEWLVGELHRREGWSVDETGRQGGPDGNIDLRMTKGSRRAIVQCKRWTARFVGVDEIRSFGGTLLREGLTGPDGVFVTLSDFTDQAIDEAKGIGLVLVGRRELYARLEAVRRPEPCPVCSTPMQLDRSQYGWWFRCKTQGCSGKRDLGADPARAIELLTEAP